MVQNSTSTKPPIVIKKYANRRLYNTATSSYVTLDHLCQLVKTGEDFVVYDAKSGEDITRAVLTQIIVEEEGKGQNMLPIGFLRQLIALYGDSLQAVVPSYLELTMSSFTKNQEQMRAQMAEAFGELNPFRHFEDLGRQNMAMIQRAMALFAPFARESSGARETAGARENPSAHESSGPARPEAREEGEIAALKSQINAMQDQLAELAKKKP